MIVAKPDATAVTTPVVAFTVAIDVLPLLHVPPETAWLSVDVKPTHALRVPVIAAGVASIVT